MSSLTWSNPLWYRKYRIYAADDYNVHGYRYAYCHDDFDGAPDANDNRCGYAHTIEECVDEIDELEGETE